MINQLIFVIPCLVGIFLFIQRLTQLTIAQSIFFTVSLLGIINYIAILWNAIYLVDSILISFGFIWFFIAILQGLRQRHSIELTSLAPLFVFVVLISLISLAISDAYLHYWDEFSFWGKISKAIFLTNHLPDINTPINFKDYPPGVALFHYFIYRIAGYFSEPLGFLAQDILLIAPLLAIAAASRAQIKITQILTVLILLIAVIAFYEPALFHKLYVDILVGSFFAGAMTTIYLTDNNYQKCLTLLPVILFLPLIKQAGLFFAWFALIMLTLDGLLHYRRLNAKNHRRFFVFYLLLMSSLLILIHQSWALHYLKLNVEKTFATHSMSTITVIKDLIYTQDSTISTIKRIFFTNWFFSGREISSRLHTSVAIQLLIFMGLGYWLIRREKSSWTRTRYGLLITALVIGLISYSGGLLVFYMYSFSNEEAVRVACFGRYMHIYLIAFALIMVGLLSKYIPINFKNNQLVTLILLGLFVGAILTGKPHERILNKRYEVLQMTQQIPQLNPKMKLFVVYQNDQKDESTFIHMLKYQLFPIKVNPYPSFGKAYYPGDISTCERTTKEFIHEASQYDYLLIAHADEKFWQQYGALFPKKITSPQLYKIDEQGRFHPIG